MSEGEEQFAMLDSMLGAQKKIKLLTEDLKESESVIEKQKIIISVLASIIVLMIAFTFLSPVDVKVGDVCLSCWGNYGDR